MVLNSNYQKIAEVLVGNNNYGNVYLRIYAKLNSQNIANNSSSVTYQSRLQVNSGTVITGNTTTKSLSGTGATSVNAVKANGTYNSGETVLSTITGTVIHNDDGTASISTSATFKSTPWSWNKSVSGNADLPTIARASNVTATDAAIESSTSINISKASDSFTHTLSYSFEGLTGTIATNITGTSYGWKIPTSFYAKMTDKAIATCTIICDTYNGDILIGTKTTTFNVTINESISKPSISATFKDVNSVSTNLTGNNQKIVKYVSNVQVTISASGKNGATIMSKQVTCGDGKFVLENGTINAVESGDFVASAIDSRNIQNSVSYKLSFVDYIKLSLSVDAYRTSPTNNQIACTFKGNFFNASFGSVTNTLALKYRYRKQGSSSWSSYSSLSTTKSGNTYSNGTSPINLGSNFDYTSAYEFEFVATDKVYTNNEVVFAVNVPAGVPVFDWDKDDFKHNTIVYLKSGNEILDYTKDNNLITFKDDKNNTYYAETGLFKKVGTFNGTK